MNRVTSHLTLPNLLSGCRIASVPFLLVIAWLGDRSLYVGLLIAALLTDLIDGPLARRLNQRTELGARLDLWGDAGVFLTLPFAFGWLWPGILRSEMPCVVLALASYALSAGLAFWKFGTLASYHTWLGKAATVGLSLAAVGTMLGGPAPLLRAGVLFINLAILEEIAISLVLRTPRVDVPTWWHARRLESGEGKTPAQPTEGRQVKS